MARVSAMVSPRLTPTPCTPPTRGYPAPFMKGMIKVLPPFSSWCPAGSATLPKRSPGPAYRVDRMPARGAISVRLRGLLPSRRGVESPRKMTPNGPPMRGLSSAPSLVSSHLGVLAISAWPKTYFPISRRAFALSLVESNRSPSGLNKEDKVRRKGKGRGQIELDLIGLDVRSVGCSDDVLAGPGDRLCKPTHLIDVESEMKPGSRTRGVGVCRRVECEGILPCLESCAARDLGPI